MSCLRLSSHRLRSRVKRVMALWLLLVVASAGGCAGSQWIKERRQPALPIASDLDLFSWRGPQATPRTRQLLRRYDLAEVFDRAPEEALAKLLESDLAMTSPEHKFAIAEIGFIAGRMADDRKHWAEALDWYGISVANAYTFLLDRRFDATRNPYDPQFRLASDLYNAALESTLRIVRRQGKLQPGATHLVTTATQEYEIQIVCRGPWQASDISELKFVSDYEIQGLKNHYRTYGLGVPLIGIHSNRPGNRAAERYYPPGMSVPMTAFLRVLSDSGPRERGQCVRHVCIVELQDPLNSTDVAVEDRLVPLETDLTTPLAYSLNDPEFKQANTATLGLLNPEKSRQHQGLYLLEPYDPNKIPVLMIHGLWSNLVTWMEMFNDLRGQPEIRDNFQFWFYLYPTGQPLLLTATQLRAELTEARRVLDPEAVNNNLDQIVLVGHSMGGLIARLQTLESGDNYWQLLSDQPLNELDVPDEVKADLRDALYFQPNPSVKRVVTIASPHRGSAFSNEATRWLGRKLITVPAMVVRTREQLLLATKNPVRKQGLLEVQTSLDSLSPTSPILEVMQQSTVAPWVEYHNIIGVISEDRVISKVAGQSDGVVTLESARLPFATSEVVVNADHMNIHMHPRAVLEVQRILLRHLDQAGRLSTPQLPESHEELPVPTDSRSVPAGEIIPGPPQLIHRVDTSG